MTPFDVLAWAEHLQQVAQEAPAPTERSPSRKELRRIADGAIMESLSRIYYANIQDTPYLWSAHLAEHRGHAISESEIDIWRQANEEAFRRLTSSS